jgi:hypothetical protein
MNDDDLKEKGYMNLIKWIYWQYEADNYNDMIIGKIQIKAAKFPLKRQLLNSMGK